MTTDYDVVVIGAGIHGAGVAQAAAAAGHSVLVLEREQPAAATSSRSSKLIHGGLRYLEHGHVGLVREALQESDRLLRLAPKFVWRVPFHIPIYSDSHRRPWQIRAGLTLYRILGGLQPHTGPTHIPRRDWASLDGLTPTGLKAVFHYSDAQTDDAALTRAVLRSAQTLGAELRYPADFSSAHRQSRGFQVRFLERGAETVCRTRTLVNATGPWTNTLLERIHPRPARLPVELVQGAHIVLAGELRQGAYYVEAVRDGRPVFVLPWQGRILVGTTETPYAGDPGEAAPRPEEIAYLQETARRFFPRLDTTVVASFAGVRVLPNGTGSLARRSRETILQADDDRAPRLVTIYGGKLTTYRTAAARVQRLLAATLPAARARADTAALPLTD